MAKTEAELDAALIAIDEQRAAAAMPPAPTPEQIAADDAALAQYRTLKQSNPFAASRFCDRHQGAIYRAMVRNPDEFMPQRAVAPRHPNRI